jgi:RNA polymerase sigma factor (sigma-70 family)
MTGVQQDVRELVAAAQQGSEEAWSELVEQFAGLVWHVVRGFRLSSSLAEDIYQTTWLRLAEHIDRIRQPESLGSWLARTAKNECLRAVKAKGRERLRDDLDVDLVDPDVRIDGAIEDAARAEILWKAFATLSEGCQRLLRLLMAEPPLSYQRVSEALEISVGSIGPTRARCLAKLRVSRGMYLLGEGP